MKFNVSQREITLKVVYYGPPLSGKTTNLQVVHKQLSPERRGRLTVLDTADDRTLFFDLLPVSFVTRSGYSIKLKLFTVPGQVIHAATRRLVLDGADGLVFVADSQRVHAKLNNEFWRGMQIYMKENGLDPETTPTVIQFNKRDLPDVRSDEEIAAMSEKGREPMYTAVAIQGGGVLETLHGLLNIMFEGLESRYNFSEKFGVSADEFVRAIFGEDFSPDDAYRVRGGLS